MKKLFLLSTLIICSVWSLGGDFYDVNTINTIKIYFEESNWDELLDDLYAAGEEERLTGNVMINGVLFEDVGIRYKGNSSYNSTQTKNPFNIKLDYLNDSQELGEYGTLKLSNVYKDPSFVREVLSYEIARKYLPSSKANFAKVFVNDTYIGLYTNVQDVDKYFAETHFKSRKNAFFKGELTNTFGEVVIWGYQGELENSYYNYYELESDEGWEDLIHFLDVLNNDTDSIEDVLNVDRHLWMLAFDILMVNLDAPVNFGHNYYLYKDDSGRFNPIIWDLNENFGVFARLMTGENLSTTAMQQLYPFLNENSATYPIISKILSNSTYKKIFVAHMKTIIEENFENNWYRERAGEIQNIIDSEVNNDPNKFYTYDNFKSNLDESISNGGMGGPGGALIGITELMEARIDYINSLSEFTSTAPTISEVNHSDGTIMVGSNISINANVDNADVVYMAYRTSLVDEFEKIQMWDDGIHNDNNSGDGVYGITITASGGDIQYYIYAENSDAVTFNPERAEYEFHSISVSTQVVINELMADNDATASDSSGEYDDWIELYNTGDEDVSLNGYYLTDDRSNLTQWVFPDVSIPANGYLIIWADNDEEQSGLHASFKISASGEEVLLVAPDLSIVDEVTFSDQETDQSYARLPNGTGDWTATVAPTFSSENGVDTDVSTVYIPHIDWSSTWSSFLLVSNAGINDTSITVTLFNENGGEKMITETVNAGCSKSIDLSEGTCGTVTYTGSSIYLKESFVCNTEGGGFAEFELDNNTSSELFYLFPQYTAEDLTWMGLAVMNPNNSSASITLNAFDSSGAQIGSTDFILESNKRSVGILSDFFSGIDFSKVARVKLTSTVPVTGINISGFNNEKLLFTKALSKDTLVDKMFVSHIANQWDSWKNILIFDNLGDDTGKINLVLFSGGNQVVSTDISVESGEMLTLNLNNYKDQNVETGILTVQSGNVSVRQSFKHLFEGGVAEFLLTDNAFLNLVYNFPFYVSEKLNWMGMSVFNTSSSDDYAILTAYKDGIPVDSVQVEIDGYSRIAILLSDIFVDYEGEIDRVMLSGNNKFSGINISGNDRSRLLFTSAFQGTETNLKGSVVINEVLSHSHGENPDWIELFNNSDQSIDLSGWFLSDDSENLTKYQISDGTVLDVGQYLVFYEDKHFGVNSVDSGVNDPFALSENGETVYLSSGYEGVLTGLVHSEEFGASETDVSFGRYYKESTDSTNFVAMETKTPNQANSDPLVGPIVISEIMYHPALNSDAEYIELVNISDSVVTLFDSDTNEPWIMSDGIEYSFSSTPLSMAPGEVILLVKDIDAVNEEFEIPEGITVLSWNSGSLSNSGEKIELSMPGDVNDELERQYIRVDRINYDDSAPWALEADGSGFSLIRINNKLYGNDCSNWMAGTPTPGLVE